MDYSELQNGSDIRGVAMEGVPGQRVNLGEQACRDIGRGFAVWLKERLHKDALRVAIGRDSRLSGPALADRLGEALAAEGIAVTDFGMASTPAMFMSTVTDGYRFDASVMITASHLPFNRNGFKFFTQEGGLEKQDIKAILTLAASNAHTGLPAAAMQTGCFMPVYAELLCRKVREATGLIRPLEGLRIVVDAGNGAGGFYAAQVLEPLGADTTGSRYLDPDGTFPNHIPNPENETAMAAITEAVLQNRADLGIIFDTDVDRAGAVLSDGRELNRNRLIAITAAILLKEHPGTTIVTDSITSTGLAAFIAAHGGVHHRFKRGYRNVINESIRLNAEGHDSQLAMETSGHGALKENYFLDDGAYLVTRLLIELSRARREGYTLESLIADLKEPAESGEFRMNLLLPDFRTCGSEILEQLHAFAASQPGWTIAPDNYEGVRVNLDAAHGNGWFLLRMSLHDPLMPLNIESDSVGGMKVIARELYPFLAQFDGLDTSALAECIR